MSASKVENTFDSAEARKCLMWLRDLTGDNICIEQSDERYRMMENVYNNLKNGMLLCRAVNQLLPPEDQLDFSKSVFQPTKNLAFASARERERITLFVEKCLEFGVPETNTFQTEQLYEKTNLVQVCVCIRSLGIEAESRKEYFGTHRWPKKSEENKRLFTEDQLQAGKQVINLQYGTNKGATQAGMTFGKQRMIID